MLYGLLSHMFGTSLQILVWHGMVWFSAVWYDVLPVWDKGAKLGCTVGNVDGGWV